MPLGSSSVASKPAWRWPLTVGIRNFIKRAVHSASLPPPSLTGSAASNPRSVYNPLALAYLGDAVWEAHTRRLETYIEAAWNTQQQRRRKDQGVDAADEVGAPVAAVAPASSRRFRGGARVTFQQQQQPGHHYQRAAQGPARGSNGGRVIGDNADPITSEGTIRDSRAGGADGKKGDGKGGSSGGGLMSLRRQDRKQWSTANFQALVFDALMEGHLSTSASAAHPASFPLRQPAPPPPSPSPPSLQMQSALQSARSNSAVTSGSLSEPSSYSFSPTSTSSLNSRSVASDMDGPLEGLSVATTQASPADSPTGAPPLLPVSARPPAAQGGIPSASPESQSSWLGLTDSELDVLRWGRNAAVSSVPKDVPAGVYKKATAVEVLVAHLYLTNPDRCAALIEAAVTGTLSAAAPGSSIGARKEETFSSSPRQNVTTAMEAATNTHKPAPSDP